MELRSKLHLHLQSAFHSIMLSRWRLSVFILSLTSMKFEMAEAQDNSCLHLIPLPPILPNFFEFIPLLEDNETDLATQGLLDDIISIESSCNCNATSTNYEQVNIIRECPRVKSSDWTLDYSHCMDQRQTTLPVTDLSSDSPTFPGTLPSLNSSISISSSSPQNSSSSVAVETTIRASNSTRPGKVDEIESAPMNGNHKIIIAVSVIGAIIFVIVISFILYRFKDRWPNINLVPTKRWFVRQNTQESTASNAPISMTATSHQNTAFDNPELTEDLDNGSGLGDHSFSTFGRSNKKSGQSPENVYSNHSSPHSNNNRRPHIEPLDLQPTGQANIECPPQSLSLTPTPTSPSAGFNAGIPRGTSMQDLV